MDNRTVQGTTQNGAVIETIHIGNKLDVSVIVTTMSCIESFDIATYISNKVALYKDTHSIYKYSKQRTPVLYNFLY